MAFLAKKVTVGKDWVQLSTGNCLIQNEIDSDVKFHLAASATKPAVDAVRMRVPLNEPVNPAAGGTPIWCRLAPVKKTGLNVADITAVIHVWQE